MKWCNLFLSTVSNDIFSQVISRSSDLLSLADGCAHPHIHSTVILDVQCLSFTCIYLTD